MHNKRPPNNNINNHISITSTNNNSSTITLGTNELKFINVGDIDAPKEKASTLSFWRLRI